MFAKFPTWTVWQVTSLITRTWPSSWRGNSLPSRYFVKVTHQSWTFTHKQIPMLASATIFQHSCWARWCLLLWIQPPIFLLTIKLYIRMKWFIGKVCQGSQYIHAETASYWLSSAASSFTFVCYWVSKSKGETIDYTLLLPPHSLWWDVKTQQSVNKVHLYWWICN